MKEGRMTDTLKGELVAQFGQQPLPASDNSSHDGDDVGATVEHGDGEPKRGTLAWLQAQPTVTLADGTTVPACHRIPEGAELAQPDADSHCRVIVGGERCKGTR